MCIPCTGSGLDGLMELDGVWMEFGRDAWLSIELDGRYSSMVDIVRWRRPLQQRLQNVWQTASINGHSNGRILLTIAIS